MDTIATLSYYRNNKLHGRTGRQEDHQKLSAVIQEIERIREEVGQR